MIAVRSLPLLRDIILRYLVSHCNHVKRSKYAMLIKTTSRLASDPLQHVINFWRHLSVTLCVDGAKTCHPKRGFYAFALNFLPLQNRFRFKLHYQAMTSARTTFHSSAFPTICDLRNAWVRRADATMQPVPYRPIRPLRCNPSFCFFILGFEGYDRSLNLRRSTIVATTSSIPCSCAPWNAA